MTLLLPFPNFDPVLIEFGRIGDFPLAIRWYGLLWITGCLLAWWNAIKYFERSHQLVTRKDIDDFLIWGLLGTVIGGRIGYGIFYSNEHFSLFQIWQGGLSFHGGLLGVILAVVIYTRLRAIPFWKFS